MTILIDKLILKDYAGAHDAFISTLMEKLGPELQKRRQLDEYRKTVRRIGRLNYISIRVRRGKVQRRKKVSAVKGWTLRGGHFIRIRASERLHRRLGARRAKIKRRAMKSRIRRRTAFAMRKRRSLGLSYRPFGR
jgi:hypothetical protein